MFIVVLLHLEKFWHISQRTHRGPTHMFSHAANHTSVTTLQMWYHCEGEICFHWYHIL